MKMSVQESTTNEKLIINPEYKQQILALKTIANTELNIQISLDKMVSDKEYRMTVLSELDGLGSQTLNELVSQLKQMSVYIKIETTESVDIPIKTVTEKPINTPVPETKKSPLLTILIALLLIFIVLGIASWQSGYLNVSVGNQNVEQSFVEVEKNESGIIVEQVDTIEIPDEPEIVDNTEPEDIKVASVVIVPVAQKAKIPLPINNPTVTLRLHGSNTIGEKLAPALLEAYLLSKSVTNMKWVVKGDLSAERELQYVQNDAVYAIQLHAHGSSTGFKDLLADTADIGMSSRKIKDDEVEALRLTKGDLSSSDQEVIIGLDSLAIIVHKDNPVTSLSNGDLAKIFSGEINNWREVGGDDLDINLYARDSNSGTWDIFNSLVLKANIRQLNKNTQRYESSTDLSIQVAQDVASIGFIGLPYVNNAKALAISATYDSAVIHPTRFTTSTEDYILSRRLYMYVPAYGNVMAQDFSRYVVSLEGQNVVDQIGFVSQNIQLEETYKVINAPEKYNQYAEVASRLSVNFHFESGSNEFDNKAKLDIKRLAEYLSRHRGRRVVLMGFSDSLGDPSMNVRISLLRANLLEKELNAYGLTITAVEGFGAKLPIASNDTAAGRSKNRRVEVWVY
tara:strand:+ start:9510 stop:11381 length:1872 start_codon:yes stop_codon:yes gene_type:complete